jgi:hypothetical protein
MKKSVMLLSLVVMSILIRILAPMMKRRKVVIELEDSKEIQDSDQDSSSHDEEKESVN